MLFNINYYSYTIMATWLHQGVDPQSWACQEGKQGKFYMELETCNPYCSVGVHPMKSPKSRGESTFNVVWLLGGT